ncbi:MAG: IS6 family transposase [Gammaproteobacteria bacterium]|nr:IS6 family transposase [Gammaproteobacteria bacterium]
MKERGFEVDHSTIQRWLVHYASLLEEVFHKKKKRPGDRWRLDETYIKVKGQWKYFYRAVDKQGNTIDFLYCPACCGINSTALFYNCGFQKRVLSVWINCT